MPRRFFLNAFSTTIGAFCPDTCACDIRSSKGSGQVLLWGLCGTFGVISALESPRSSKRKIDILNPLSASHQAVADFEKMTKWFLKTACNHQSLPRFMFHICQVVPLLICHLMENQEKSKANVSETVKHSSDYGFEK